MVCTKTLYNYLRLDLIHVNALDLPLLLKRSTKKLRTRKHKRALRRSIDERPASVDERTEFGHWELDSVLKRSVAWCNTLSKKILGYESPLDSFRRDLDF